MATRTSSARKTGTTKASTNKTPAAKKTTSRKPPAKKALPKTAPVNKATTVDLRHPLPVRRKVFVGPLGATEQAAIRAALASAAARLPVPVRAWHGPTAHLPDGTVLTHTPAHATTEQTPAFHAAIRCPHGAVHAYTIRTAADLQQARTLTARCQQSTQPAPATPTLNPAIRRLGDTPAAADETQPMDTTQITAGLTARADNDTAREHPEP